MPTYREHCCQVRPRSSEIDAARARELVDAGAAARRRRPRAGRVGRGAHPGRRAHPARATSSRASSAPRRTRARPIVIYCAAGNRSAFAAKTLEELGYEDVVSLVGRLHGLEARRLPRRRCRGRSTSAAAPPLLAPPAHPRGRRARAAEAARLASVLLIGAGGLGSPASLYLAAAGVGTLGIVDADVVDETNLQRQIVHSTARLGEPKVELGEARRSRRSTPT